MAVSTWLTSVEPVVHADPTEVAMPSRSSASATELPSVSRAMIERWPGQPVLGMTGHLGAGDGQDGLREAVAQAAQARDGRGPLLARQVVGGRRPDGSGHVLGPGAPVALLGAALLLRQDVGPVADVERPGALRALELVRAERHEVGAERLDIDVDVRRGLDGVDVEEDARCGRGRRSAISAIGWIVPTSLLASITETRIVRSVSAASSWSGSTRPYRSTGSSTISNPNFSR